MTENNEGAAGGQPERRDESSAPLDPRPAAATGEQPSPWAGPSSRPGGEDHGGEDHGTPEPSVPTPPASADATPAHGTQFFPGGHQHPGHQQPGHQYPGHQQPGHQQQGAGLPGSGQPGAVQGAPGQPYYHAPGQQPVRTASRGRGRAVAGVAALVLLVGGVAGGVGGYVGHEIAADGRTVVNALDQTPGANRTSNDAPEGSIEQVAQKVLPTVVQLRVSNRQVAGEGSGIVISSDGDILTNNHVIEAAADGGTVEVVFQTGQSVPATILGRDPDSDLAVVKAQNVADLPVAALGTSGDLRIGQGVVAIGSPFELSGTVTSGIVSSLDRPVRAGGEEGSQASVLNAIQTDAAINPGNSGGPLVNMQGQVIGINSAIYSPNSTQSSQGGSVGIGFAIPIDQARRTAKEIAETGKATQTVLGVSVTDGEDGGALVREVTAGGAAEQAGIKTGDVITKLDDRAIETSDALVAAVRSKSPNDRVKLTVGGNTVEVTLGGQTVEPK
ncbi:trypsin-like peptidase domain-containing protein [Umezawaea beigongshangensis]|uniref:trypsin-like peptidase domain-containing protein n=1 Tax=Umezawaea beigongshangensis TaxID=2780383 RepID=UPI0018F1799E|nr:trypsin-like peptidase domain-containing protein [Umezawaea beigongshangensis]